MASNSHLFARPGTEMPLTEPPPLPQSAERGDRWLPLWLFSGALALVAGLRLAGQWQLPLPKCWLRTFTGVPCPSCGCTRSLLAWSHFDLAQAFNFNPLFFVCCVAGLLWLALWAAERFLHRPWLRQWRARADRWPVGRVFLALVALNWLYLCLRLPK
jgi:Protein of unknown function (DUF2752)